jgi:amino acid transporter
MTNLSVHSAFLIIYIFNAWIIGENIGPENNQLPPYHGRIDATLSVVIAIAKEESEGLGICVTVSLILVGLSAAVSTLFVASRLLYGMSVVHSGRHDGTSGINDGRTKLPRLWSSLTRRTRFWVPRGSILASTILPVVLELTDCFEPVATGHVSFAAVYYYPMAKHPRFFMSYFNSVAQCV